MSINIPDKIQANKEIRPRISMKILIGNGKNQSSDGDISFPSRLTLVLPFSSVILKLPNLA